MVIGVLTGGGDCPGLNAVIRALVRTSVTKYGSKVIGILEGWRGLVENNTCPLGLDEIKNTLRRGGTILRTSRTNPFKKGDDAPEVKKCLDNIKALKLDALVAIGGDDTLGVAHKLSGFGVKSVGVPKTIDNDLSATDVTFGYDTAVSIATECIDRLHTTADSHNRVIVVEVMGRHAGWIAIHSGIAGGADVILIPEKEADAKAVCDLIRKRHGRGKNFSIVVAAEGARLKGADLATKGAGKDAFGHELLGGIGDQLAKLIEKETGFETRAVVLGHIQRGGSPTAFDRILATRFGFAAAELVHKGQFGKMVALQANKIVAVPLQEALKQKTVSDDWYELAEVFFG